MANIKDVALLAGVSVATVSRVINGKAVVQLETRKRVEDAIKQLSYSPNLLGRSLRRQETKKVIVMLNTISNQFYSRVVKGIEETAQADGYTVMVCTTHGDTTIEERVLGLLQTHAVDGAILLSCETDCEKLTEMLSELPVVQACEPLEQFATPKVSIDNRSASYEAVCYLIRHGHKDIAFLGAQGIYPSSRLREEGFRLAMSENGIPVRGEWMFREGFSFNAGIRAAEQLLKQNRLPTAVFCISDSCAAGVIKRLAESGIATPADISVMGFDDTQLSQIYIPSITTMRQPQYELGKQAMIMLLMRMQGKQVSTDCLMLPHQIIVRDSVSELPLTVEAKAKTETETKN